MLNINSSNCLKHEQLLQLYNEKMFNSKVPIQPVSSAINNPVSCFCCKNYELCQVGSSDPIYTGLLGDCDSDILVVGEAPSGSDLKNDTAKTPIEIECTSHDAVSFQHAHWCGYTKDIPKKGFSRLYDFIDFIRYSCLESNNRYPYFTDVIKCGLSRQNTNEKRLLGPRAKICADHILLQEIQIINPRIIACAGKFAYSVVLDLQKTNKTLAGITILKFMHYSHQAQLKVTIEEKKSIIWRLQAKCVEEEKCCEMLKDISSIKELCDNEEQKIDMNILPEYFNDEEE